jgi:hypothetical protein
MKIISLFSALLFALILCVSAHSSSAQSTQSVSGRVIHAEYGFMVVKTGYKETEFGYEPDVEIILSQQAKELEGPQTIEICQYVRITYTFEEKMKKAVKIEIIKPSDCYK